MINHHWLAAIVAATLVHVASATPTPRPHPSPTPYVRDHYLWADGPDWGRQTRRQWYRLTCSKRQTILYPYRRRPLVNHICYL